MSDFTIDDIRAAMKEAKAITAKMEMSQAGFNLHAITDKCPHCGYKYSANNGTLRVCNHQLAAIKEHCPPAPEVHELPPFMGVNSLLGMRVEVHSPPLPREPK